MGHCVVNELATRLGIVVSRFRIPNVGVSSSRLPTNRLAYARPYVYANSEFSLLENFTNTTKVLNTKTPFCTFKFKRIKYTYMWSSAIWSSYVELAQNGPRKIKRRWKTKDKCKNLLRSHVAREFPSSSHPRPTFRHETKAALVSFCEKHTEKERTGTRCTRRRKNSVGNLLALRLSSHLCSCRGAVSRETGMEKQRKTRRCSRARLEFASIKKTSVFKRRINGRKTRKDFLRWNFSRIPINFLNSRGIEVYASNQHMQPTPHPLPSFMGLSIYLAAR